MQSYLNISRYITNLYLGRVIGLVVMAATLMMMAASLTLSLLSFEVLPRELPYLSLQSILFVGGVALIIGCFANIFLRDKPAWLSAFIYGWVGFRIVLANNLVGVYPVDNEKQLGLAILGCVFVVCFIQISIVGKQWLEKYQLRWFS